MLKTVMLLYGLAKKTAPHFLFWEFIRNLADVLSSILCTALGESADNASRLGSGARVKRAAESQCG